MKFIVNHCNNLTVIKFRMYKEAAVLSASMEFMTEVTMLCWFLQSCTDSLHILPGSSSVTYAASFNISNVKVEEDIVVIEEGSIAIHKEVDLGIKQEEIPEDINFSDIIAEPDEVSYVCICLLLDMVYLCAEMSFVFVMSTFLANLNSCTSGKVRGSILDGFVLNICREDEVHSCIHVGKNPYPQDVS